ncbi:protein FAM187B [Leptodactylus fuscus]|uniref:protein FAM187B n=1 Tax=Leptodactylus fuscus TaxID=238119 RepID=UPI003F4E9A12
MCPLTLRCSLRMRTSSVNPGTYIAHTPQVRLIRIEDEMYSSGFVEELRRCREYSYRTTSANGEDSATVSCPAYRPCTMALASENSVTLKCEHAAVYWQYLDISQPHARPLTFIQSNGLIPQDEDLNNQENLTVLGLMSRSQMVSGNLKLLYPKVQDTGIYTCRSEGRHLAYYKIDFQDAKNIYVSHASLGDRVRPNTTIDLGGGATAKVFTLWSDWQSCDRCGVLGERKKVGFCYMKITRNSTDIEEPQPCGLMQSNNGEINFFHTPELRIEMCKEPCTEVTSTEELTLEIVNYHTFLHADALLTCPSSSIYRPVSWSHENTSFTRLQQMMNNASYVLDKTTGGGALFIPILNKSDEGVYKCYIGRRLAGRFYVIFPSIQYTSAPQQFSILESIVLGLLMFLLLLTLLLTCLQPCKETTRRVI